MKDDSIANAECCMNCKFFEQRTCFCRYNPPTPLVTTDKESTFVNAVFPKISFPKFDYCHKFIKK